MGHFPKSKESRFEPYNQRSDPQEVQQQSVDEELEMRIKARVPLNPTLYEHKAVLVGKPRTLGLCSVLGPEKNIVDKDSNEDSYFNRYEMKSSFAKRKISSFGDLRNMKSLYPSSPIMINDLISKCNNNNYRFKLDNGYPEKFIIRDSTVDEKLDHLIYGASHSSVLSPKFSNELSPRKAIENLFHNERIGFSCFRGQLSKLMILPYDNNNELNINVIKHNGIIYLCEHKTEEKKDNFYGQLNSDEERMTYSGYKFEELLTKQLFNKDNRSDNDINIEEFTNEFNESIVNTNDEFLVLSRLAIGPHRLFVGAEVDCFVTDNKEEFEKQMANIKYDENIESSKIKYLEKILELINKGFLKSVELKTHREIMNDGHYKSFLRYKMLKTWTQCFLPGTERIIVGFRDPKSLELKSVNGYKTLEVPRLIRDFSSQNLRKDFNNNNNNNVNNNNNLLWNPDVCINFLSSVLDMLCKLVVKNDTMYKLTVELDKTYSRSSNYNNKYNDKSYSLLLTELPLSDRDKLQFLPNWFINDHYKK